MLECILIGAFGFAWAEKITKEAPGVCHLRHLVQTILDRTISSNAVRSWVEKPLYLCSGCVAGQTALWVALYRGHDLFSTVLTIGGAVTSAMIIHKYVKG